MPKKVKATKTLNPLHFEDLEPHRFEDLVRRLLYSFRDWRDIEATGRSGSDEGFDIRAWEKADSITNVSEEGEEGEHLSDGNLWQIQGKREKSISPARMRKIIKDDVDGEHPPYGYILAAATNISKKTYDTFRAELRKKGVREFHFWGKDHLEDQLALPENDEILFTFFGISLSPRRRARTVEIKFALNNKNKMLKMLYAKDALIEHQEIKTSQSMLLRDIKDRHYPDKTQYADFGKRRRWEEHEAVHLSATGLFFKAREWYAYLNAEAKEWDATKTVDLMPRRHNLDELNERRGQDIGKRAEYFWRHLPLRFQAKVIVYGFVKFEDMLIIDDRGDPEYAMPHVFVDFGEQEGPFAGTVADLAHGNRETIPTSDLAAQYKRISIFPETFPEPTKGNVHELDKLGLTGTPLTRLHNTRRGGTLYSFDEKLDFLSEGDIIRIPKTEESSMDKHVEITHISEVIVGDYIEGSDYRLKEMEEYAGRAVKKEEKLTIYEIIQVYTWDKYLTYYDHDGY